MKRLFNKDVPFITYIIHDKNMKNGRAVTVYKPTQEYYILFELIKFRRLPATFPDIGITVISEGLEPSPSDVSVTQNVLMDIKKDLSDAEYVQREEYQMKPKDVLQPCPFCGLHVELVSAKTYPNGERSPAYIKCKRCNYHIAGYEDKDVINQWNTRSAIHKEFCPNCEAETPCTHEAELYACDICGEDFAKYIVSRNCNVSDVSMTQDVSTPEPPEGA